MKLDEQEIQAIADQCRPEILEVLKHDWLVRADDFALMVADNADHIRQLARERKIRAWKRGRVWLFCPERSMNDYRKLYEVE